jgi:hypothetical protein
MYHLVKYSYLSLNENSLNILQGKNLISRVEFLITIVNNNEITSAGFEILKTINKLISRELTLSQDDSPIGSAKIKINSVESRKNNLVLTLVAILKLAAIYEDE